MGEFKNGCLCLEARILRLLFRACSLLPHLPRWARWTCLRAMREQETDGQRWRYHCLLYDLLVMLHRCGDKSWEGERILLDHALQLYCRLLPLLSRVFNLYGNSGMARSRPVKPG